MILTGTQFQAAQSALDTLCRQTRRGSPERALAEILNGEWETILARSEATAAQRDARAERIAEFAVAKGLVTR